MKKEIDLKVVIEILTKHLKTMIAIKTDLIELKDYEKVAIFRDYEKEIENRISLLEGKNSQNIENSPSNEIEQFNCNFTTETAKIINYIDKPIFTNKIVVSITERLNIVSDEILKMDIDLNDLRTELTSIFINDFVTKDNPNISHNSLKGFKTSFLEAKKLREKEVSISTLFLSILRNETDLTTKILNRYGINYDSFSLKLAK